MADDLGINWWEEEGDSEDQDQSASDEETKDDQEQKMSEDEIEVERQDIQEKSVSIAETKEKPVDSNEKKSKNKKKRQRKKKSITEELKKTGDIAATADDVIGFLNKQFEGKLSTVERDEISLDTKTHFFEANTAVGYPVAYLKTILHKWKKLKAQPLAEGSPLLLVVSPSAIRAVQLNRQIQDFKGSSCKCAKLFAKHMKLEGQQEFLKKTVCHIGVGTPNRISALVKSGHLKLDKLMAIVIDWNWRDVKSHRLVDIPEVRTELATLLQKFIIPHIKSDNSSCKIGIL